MGLDRRWPLAVIAAGLGAGALARYRVGDSHLVLPLVFALSVGLFAFPLAVGDAALGRFRRRNVVDAFAGSWAVAGWLAVAASLALAAVLSIIAAWAARYVIASFFGDFYEDPARFWRLAEQGWEVVLLAFGAFVVAAAAATSKQPLRWLAATAVLVLVAAAAFVAYALLATGASGRDAAFPIDPSGLRAGEFTRVILQALLPGFVGLAVLGSWLRGDEPGPDVARGLTTAAIAWVAVPVLLAGALAALAHEHDVDLAGQRWPFDELPILFATIGGTLGGVLSGTFYGILLAAALSAMVAVLQVPARVVAERAPEGRGWTLAHGVLASAAAAYLLALPMAFMGRLAHDVDVVLRAIVAPLGGLLLSLHLGWARREALDGFIVGDADHDLGRLLRPLLRFALPILLLALLGLGAMYTAVEFGAARGAGGLWRLVP